MPDEPTTDTAPVEAQEAPPEAPAEQPTPPWGTDEEFNPEKAWKLIQDLRADKDKLKPLADKARELEQAQMSEQERLTAALDAAQAEGTSAKTEAAKLRAAIKHRLSEDDLELLGDGTPEQIEERAEKLAVRIGSNEEPVVPVTRRQGGDGQAPAQSPEQLADAVIKRQRGY